MGRAGDLPAAYALSGRNTFAQKPLLMIVIAAILFGPGMIPTYLVVRSVGLLDSYWALILPKPATRNQAPSVAGSFAASSLLNKCPASCSRPAGTPSTARSMISR